MNYLLDLVVDPTCSEHIPVEPMLSHDWLPIRRTADSVLVATASDVPDLRSVSEWFPGEDLVLRRVDRRVVQDLIVDTRLDEVADEMANGFTRRCPEFAARTGIRPWQKAAVLALVLLALVTLLAGGATVLAGVISAVFSACLVFKALLACVPAKRQPVKSRARELSDDELPSYTILVPAYREEDVIGETVRWIAGLDYPKDRLEVLVLVERRDEATARAVREVEPPDFVRLVSLPRGVPQTKPRSCNLGLMLARGELVVIFDAEDRPERDQLRKVANQFAAGGDRLACVQAKLNFYNESRNPLTRMFSMEYALWFDLMLVGLARLKLPVPLGGTSNHIRTGILRQVGGWDAWNVTEDADLGLRFASTGYRVEVADSTTWEECPARPWVWITQRTRWLKGYLLTLLVHTRRPVAATRRFGVLGMVSLVGVVAGTPVAFMLWPFAFVFGLVDADVPAAVMWVTCAMTAISMGIAGHRRRMAWPMAIFFPLYGLMHAFAGWRGLWQLVHAPYKWEKTAHGASRDRT